MSHKHHRRRFYWRRGNCLYVKKAPMTSLVVNMISPHKAPSMPHITFTSHDFRAIDPIQDNPMVISVEITNYIVKNTLVDQGSSTNILFWNTFKKMEIPESEILLHDDPLLNFTSEHVRTKESIWLYTKFGNVGPSQKD